MTRVIVLAALLVGALPSTASASPHLVVWAGGLAPTSAGAGLELTASGQVRTVSRDASGKLTRARVLSLQPDALARLRRAADRFLARRPRSVQVPELDGGYVAAFAQDGDRKGGAVDTGTTSADVAQLLEAVPRSVAVRSLAPKRETPPTTSPCDLGHTPTEVVQDVPMALADARHLIKLSPKGPIGGDSVAVDGQWARFPELPVHVTVHLEVGRQRGDSHPYAAEVKAELDRAYAGTVTDDGQQVNFTFDVVDRAPGAPPRKCFHEVVMHRRDDVRGHMSDVGPKQLTGAWELQEPWSWKHEIGHALGIDDHYKDFFVFKRHEHADIEVPYDPTPAQIRQAIGPGFSLRAGEIVSKPFGTTADDFMGTARNGHLRKIDARKIAMTAQLVVHDVPGEILLNKDADAQNLVVGAPFALAIPTNGFAHVDGMVAYCIDKHRLAPADDGGSALDVLGRAGDLGGDAMSALQRLIDVIAAREPGPLQETPGANEAIWRITDDLTPDDPEAVSLLDAAGIPAETTFDAPHFIDPAAATPGTVPVTLG